MFKRRWSSGGGCRGRPEPDPKGYHACSLSGRPAVLYSGGTALGGHFGHLWGIFYCSSDGMWALLEF